MKAIITREGNSVTVKVFGSTVTYEILKKIGNIEYLIDENESFISVFYLKDEYANVELLPDPLEEEDVDDLEGIIKCLKFSSFPLELAEPINELLKKKYSK